MMLTFTVIKTYLRAKYFLAQVLVVACMLVRCTDDSLDNGYDAKGKFLGNYCGGIVIQLVEGHAPVQSWEGLHSGQVFSHSLVASLDSNAFKGAIDPLNLAQDSVFYFNFREGGYPQKEFILCKPAPFITVTKTQAANKR